MNQHCQGACEEPPRVCRDYFSDTVSRKPAVSVWREDVKAVDLLHNHGMEDENNCFNTFPNSCWISPPCPPPVPITHAQKPAVKCGRMSGQLVSYLPTTGTNNLLQHLPKMLCSTQLLTPPPLECSGHHTCAKPSGEMGQCQGSCWAMSHNDSHGNNCFNIFNRC